MNFRDLLDYIPGLDIAITAIFNPFAHFIDHRKVIAKEHSKNNSEKHFGLHCLIELGYVWRNVPFSLCL